MPRVVLRFRRRRCAAGPDAGVRHPREGMGIGAILSRPPPAPRPSAGHTPIVRFATKPLAASPVTVASWEMPPSSPKTLSRVNEVRARFDALDG